MDSVICAKWTLLSCSRRTSMRAVGLVCERRVFVSLLGGDCSSNVFLLGLARPKIITTATTEGSHELIWSAPVMSMEVPTKWERETGSK